MYFSKSILKNGSYNPYPSAMPIIYNSILQSLIIKKAPKGLGEKYEIFHRLTCSSSSTKKG